MLLCLRDPWSVVFRIMTPYELVHGHQHFGATQYLHLLFYAEDGHSWNIHICLQPSILHSAITQRAVMWMLLWTTSSEQWDLYWWKITNLWFPGTPNVSSFFNWSSYRWSVFSACPYAPNQSYLGTGAAPSVLNQPGLSRPCRSWKMQPALSSSWNIKHNSPVTCEQ